MKKLMLMLALLFIPASVFAAGEFDGVWASSALDFASVTQNGDSLVIISLEPGELEWEALQGTLNGDTAVLSIVVGAVTSTVEVNFSSNSSATLRIVSCTPAINCTFQAGQEVMFTKIF